VSGLAFHERPSEGPPRGLLVLHHGRGTDEQDLLPLAGVLDPQRRLHVALPRAPLTPTGGGGQHWYLVPRVGTPDPDTFRAAFRLLAEFHDELWARTGIEPAQTVLGGFSMGAVMSYALGLAAERPAPCGILAFSGFLPRVEGWRAAPESRPGLPVFIAHGRRDAIIPVDFGREAARQLRDGGLEVDYHESEGGHHIDPRQLGEASSWLWRTLEQPPRAAS
jgi:phospholipase/carboxylesterase